MENSPSIFSAIKIGFIGDVFLGGEYLRYAQEKKLDHDYPFENFKEELSNNDILFFNLEGPIFKGNEVRKGVTSILSNHPAILDFAKCVPICIANLANNHIMDYGAEGLLETMRLLDTHNIYHVGVGANCKEASREVVMECKNRKIAVLSYADGEAHVGAVIAGDNNAGCSSFRDVEEIENRIRELKSKEDIKVFVSLHWGYEYFSYPSIEQVEIAHRLVDAGADFIIGHHPHVIQGIEEYKNSLIAYSLGNFFLPPVRMKNGRMEHRRKISQECVVLKIELGEDGSFKYNVKPGYVSRKYKLTKYDNNRENKFNADLRRLSGVFNNMNYSQFVNEYYTKRKKQMEIDDIIEAAKKLYKTPLIELIKTINIYDIKRNAGRLLKIISFNKNA